MIENLRFNNESEQNKKLIEQNLKLILNANILDNKVEVLNGVIKQQEAEF